MMPQPEDPLRAAADRPPHDDHRRTARVDARQAHRKRGENAPAPVPETWPTCPIRARCACACRHEVEGKSVAREIENRFEALRRIIPHNIIGFETATMQGGGAQNTHRTLPDARHSRKLHGRLDRRALHGHARRFGLFPLRRGVVQQRIKKPNCWASTPRDIARYGAVSEQVARQMAEGVRRTAGADLRHGHHRNRRTFGRLGGKPVGTVWIAVATLGRRSQSSNSAEPTGDRSSTAPAPSPSACCATA